MTAPKRKLIEVALPLEAINRASKAEKDRKVGKPQQIHHWWARRPIVACRAMVFAQLVDDPSSRPDLYPSEDAQSLKRKELFDLIEQLVSWDSINDDKLFARAHAEILSSTGGNPPAILDPFAGGGSIPLEAQRLGLETHASDLNPVAVLINKALLEIPARWAGQAPVFPGAAGSRLGNWPLATGIAEDVRRYGQWIREEAEKRIGHLYPTATLPDGTEAKVIAWIWARTVTCPNPACAIEMPLVQSWWLARKKGREAFVVPRIERGRVEFSIGHDPNLAPVKGSDGTVSRTGAACVACASAVPLSYIRDQGKAARIGARLMAVVAEGAARRDYLAPTPEHEMAADVPMPESAPDTELPDAALGFRVQGYGMTRHADLFTARQLTALATFSEVVVEVRDKVASDAHTILDGTNLSTRDSSFAEAYADAIAIYLALGISRLADWSNALCRWESKGQVSQQLFGRQTISMVWDYSEANTLGVSSGSAHACVTNVVRSLERLGSSNQSVHIRQGDARVVAVPGGILATDPPYYDNVPYADLSDFFYVWQRRMLGHILPDLFATVVTPKAAELVADPERRGGKAAAARYFEAGFVEVFRHVRTWHDPRFPATVFYAFKQTESSDLGTVSTGWQTLLESMAKNGWVITATWPLGTEMGSRMRGQESNALASSIVLACRLRPADAAATSRRVFTAALRDELPDAVRKLQLGGVAPVDLPQAVIGPGMGVFSRFSKVIEADGSDMTVRTGLALINQVRDEVLNQQDGDFDPDSRFCVDWFSQFGWNEADFGVADQLSRSMNTSVDGLVRAGIFWARGGRARLLSSEDLSADWNPATDDRIGIWEVALRLAKAVSEQGVEAAAPIFAAAGRRVDLDVAKEMAYRLFSICERKGWAQSALLFNGLGSSWLEIEHTARSGRAALAATQGELDYEADDEN
jgi:putative DNA methylase